VGVALLEQYVEDGQPSTKLAKMIRRLDRHKSVVKLTTGQRRMLETLERLSWIAVLLATATFIGFLQPPWGTVRQGQEGKQVVDYAGMPFANRAFFVLDTWSFLLSLACLVIIVILSMPRLRSTSDKREAGRFWLLLVLAWGLLYMAVIAGCGAFVATALCRSAPV